MRFLFKVLAQVEKPIVVGQDGKNGRRQLIPVPSGTVEGTDLQGNPITGIVLPGAVDSQVIRPDGKCELSARYGVQLSDGRSFYIENNGIRTVPEVRRSRPVMQRTSSDWPLPSTPQTPRISPLRTVKEMSRRRCTLWAST